MESITDKINVEDEHALFDLLENTTIELIKDGNKQKVLVDGIDVTDEIRMPNVTNHVSIVSQHELVRKEMVKRQQKLAEKGGVVMDGRDIGTAVLPNADLKIFLLASVEERAERRFRENQKNGIHSDFEQLKTEIARRDKLDTERKISPLKKAKDAIEIDTTSLTIDQVVQKILALASERIR